MAEKVRNVAPHNLPCLQRLMQISPQPAKLNTCQSITMTIRSSACTTNNDAFQMEVIKMLMLVVKLLVSARLRKVSSRCSQGRVSQDPWQKIRSRLATWLRNSNNSRSHSTSNSNNSNCSSKIRIVPISNLAWTLTISLLECKLVKKPFRQLLTRRTFTLSITLRNCSNTVVSNNKTSRLRLLRNVWGSNRVCHSCTLNQ